MGDHALDVRRASVKVASSTKASLSILVLGAAASLFACSAPTDDEPLEATSAAQTDPNDRSWDCYAPEPGHPTAAERAAFFTTHSAAAQEAEGTYGVPAAAILAMAAVEGGYGFTRIALYANNTFGYKFTSSAAAGGRGSWTLACQPSWDVGNRYIKFASIRDAILFVGYKLGTRADWANYKAATDAYRTARMAGRDITVAVNAWVDGIANAGYNYDPPTYKRTIKSVITANDLFRYSSAVTPGGATAAPAPGGSESQPNTSNTWIAIDAPVADAYVSGNVALRATASSDVTKVVFVSIAGTSEYVIGSATGPSFTAQWATAGWVPNGSYVLRFDAYAGTTKVASGSRRVHVAN